MKWIPLILAIASTSACSTLPTVPVLTASPSPSPTPQSSASPPISSALIYGMTLDSIRNIPKIVATVKQVPSPAAVRIVFDEGTTAKDYSEAVRQIRPYATTMGEVLDSEFVRDCDLACYKKRTLDFLGLPIDLVEIGNEMNGEWLAKGALEKVTAAFDLVKTANRTTALTLYWNGPSDDGTASCWADKENQMFTWAKNLPDRMKQGLNYVLVSFYEDDCKLAKPDWPQIFQELHRIFPNSLLGFGEVGTKFEIKKAELLQRYYSIRIPGVNFIGGWFWWYGYQDMVNGSLLNSLIEVSK